MTRVLLIFLASFSAHADGLLVNFGEVHFNQSYKHQTYIKSGEYVHIDEHYKFDETGQDVIPFVPDFYSVKLTESQEANLIADLIAFGVDKWEKRYPENMDNLLCHGLGFSLYIKHEALNIRTVGACNYPPNYKQVVELFTNIHQSPNKTSSPAQ
jgi:hypothetical protein